LSIEEKSLVRFKALVDTKPLYNIVVAQIGVRRNIGYGEELLKYLRKMGLSLASTWPVFTETLYFIYRDLGRRRDFSSKLEDVKRVLQYVEEINAGFHSVLSRITRDFDIADTALLELAKKVPVILLSEDHKLVGKARSMGITALTPYELLSLSIDDGKDT